MDCCTKSIYNQVVTIAGVQMVGGVIGLMYGALAIAIPDARENVTKYYKSPYKKEESFGYVVYSLLSIVFGLILLTGAVKKSGHLCKWWMFSAIVSYLFNRLDSLFAVASLSLESRGEFILAVLTYVFGILLWYGYAIWTVYNFIISLQKDLELTGTGFYDNMNKELQICLGPEHYKVEVQLPKKVDIVP